jgi:AbiV family abortive infection protein
MVHDGGERLPNERKAQAGATVAAANAAGLLSDADLLAGVGRYGSALSLAVLAFEESVKARTLGAIAAAAAQGRTPGFAEDDLRKIIYSSHQARHQAGLKQHLAATDPDLYGRLMLGMATSPAETAKLQALDALLASANAGKQSGFYSDFDPSAGSWTSPADVSQVGFDQIRPLIGDYVTETSGSSTNSCRSGIQSPALLQHADPEWASCLIAASPRAAGTRSR